MTLNCSINNQALGDLHSPANGLIMFKYYCCLDIADAPESAPGPAPKLILSSVTPPTINSLLN
jgi:hypothetical protein